MRRQAGLAVAALVVLGILVAGPWAPASAQTGSSVCGGPNQPCAGTPFGQVQPGTAPAAEGAAPSPLARTGVNTEHMLLASVAALALGCLVLLVVEAREATYLVRAELPDRAR